MTDATLQLTYDDYLRFPADGQRHELCGGVHVVNPAPGTGHQRLVTRVVAELFRQIEARHQGVVFPAPTAVRLSEEDGVEPDIAVVLNAGPARITEREIDGPPDLVVEILSRSTRRYDLGVKKASYERAGVPEYWVVDPVAETVARFALADGRYGAPTEHRAEIAFGGLPGVVVDLARVWLDA